MSILFAQPPSSQSSQRAHEQSVLRQHRLRKFASRKRPRSQTTPPSSTFPIVSSSLSSSSSTSNSIASTLIPIPEDDSISFGRAPLTQAPDLDQETTQLIHQARHLYHNKTLPKLQRVAALDQYALRHAQRMARRQQVHHSVTSIDQLQSALASPTVAENIHCGFTVLEMHQDLMSSHSMNRTNVRSKEFDRMGTATVLGEDGKLYSVQVFCKSNGDGQV